VNRNAESHFHLIQFKALKIVLHDTDFRISNDSPHMYDKMYVSIFQTEGYRVINHSVFVGMVCMAFPNHALLLILIRGMKLIISMVHKDDFSSLDDLLALA
jgi:hypothetical protein